MAKLTHAFVNRLLLTKKAMINPIRAYAVRARMKHTVTICTTNGRMETNVAELYRIVRFYRDAYPRRRIVDRRLTLEEAQEHCNDPETSSSTCTSYRARKRTEQMGAWFDGYEEN